MPTLTRIQGYIYNPGGILVTTGHLLITAQQDFVSVDGTKVAPFTITVDLADDAGLIDVYLYAMVGASPSGLAYFVEFDPDPDDTTKPAKIKDGYWSNYWAVPSSIVTVPLGNFVTALRGPISTNYMPAGSSAPSYADTVLLGPDPIDTDKRLIANQLGVDLPEIRFNTATGRWQFADDGVTFHEFAAEASPVISDELVIGNYDSEMKVIVANIDVVDQPKLRYNGGLWEATDDGLTYYALNPTATTGVVSSINEFRLTVESQSPYYQASGTAFLQVFLTPLWGTVGRISLFDGVAWNVLEVEEADQALDTFVVNTVYDVFASGTALGWGLSCVAWLNSTTRVVELTEQDGIPVQLGDPTKRYVGTIMMNATSGLDYSDSFMGVWNYYNQADRHLLVTEATNSWTYSVATWRNANNLATNRVQAIVGVTRVQQQAAVWLTAHTKNSTTAAGLASIAHGVGLAGASVTPMASLMGQTAIAAGSADIILLHPIHTHGRSLVTTVGLQYWQWIEKVEATGITTWYGDNGVTAGAQSGLRVTIKC